ncbi:DUF4280 domain-containing protein [Chryseobacterium sp. ISL-6]|uniref:DUF4280 domain-containing protein n=1 Tax=Chryseobacterium sp. ISL-6 TaxID=2819143 RepID=UPI001BEBF92E|nr:DUF4280 domain-containing protein [Chryseobacterium sp. ISL-6]MBT2623753.1 DUF4280 domain-containing protein [Chryseobacterium sp. ISL-6]
MTQIITENSSLSCDKGVAPSNLKVTSNVFYKADNKLIATEQDKQPVVNIPPFGLCLVTRIACVPSITKWDNTAEDTCINTQKVLTEKSKCSCSIGGIISVIDKGHGEEHAIVNMDIKPQGAGKEDNKLEKSSSNNDQSKSVNKPSCAATKPILDDKAIKELKQDTKDFLDRLLSLGNLLVSVEKVRPKTQTQTSIQTTSQTASGATAGTTTTTTTETISKSKEQKDNTK